MNTIASPAAGVATPPMKVEHPTVEALRMFLRNPSAIGGLLMLALAGGADMVSAVFRNTILQRIIGLVFNEAMTRVVRAFETRAAKLYG